MLLTKLNIPSPGKNLITRSALFDQLNEGMKRKLILISAPAGFGKTTLISNWISQCQVKAVWISLDKRDNDPSEFFTYLITGIQGISNGFGATALALLKSPNQSSPESIASLFINDLTRIEQDFVMILDDFHLISNANIAQFLTFFLEHIPDNMHLAISSRSDPMLPLARLRSQRQLVELRASDLSFSAQEISHLFNKKMRIKLSEQDIYSLESKTEGWIAGLQLAALSMQDNEDVTEFIRAFEGNNRYIMDYLIEEVLNNQPPGIRDFLLKTSVIDQFSGPLCNQVLEREDAQSLIEQLEKNNMFVVPLDSERKWYRYHHLFADLLKKRLQAEDKELLGEMHKRVSVWFEKEGLINLAVGHALETRDYQRSIELLNRCIEGMWENGQHDAILKYGDIIPSEFIKKSPAFCLFYAWIMISTGEIHKAEPFLLSAEASTKKLIHAENSSKESVLYNKKFLGKISVALAYLNSQGENSEQTSYSNKSVLENLSEDDALWLGWAWYFISNEELGRGNISKGFEALNNALKYSKKSGNLYLMSNTTSTLASHKIGQGHYKSSYKQCADLLAFMKKSGYSDIAKVEWTFAGLFSLMSVIQCIWTDFDEALENAKIAYYLCKDEKAISQKLMALFAYSYVLHAHGDKSGAAEKITEAEDILEKYKLSPFLVTIYVGWKIFLLIESDKLEEANEFAKENGLGLNKKISYENEHSYIHYTRLLIANYKFDDAALKLKELYILAEAGNRVETLVQLKIVSAIMCKMTGKRVDAVRHMIEAMELAAEENILNYFLFDIDITNDLLKDAYKIQATKETKIPKHFIDKLKLAVENKKKLERVNSEGELSNRELDTLKLIAANLSNQEIADKLYISLNTVKTHVKNILLKLEADNRQKAVIRAKERGII